jgi:hypothetical protein
LLTISNTDTIVVYLKKKHLTVQFQSRLLLFGILVIQGFEGRRENVLLVYVSISPTESTHHTEERRREREMVDEQTTKFIGRLRRRRERDGMG